MIILGIVYQSGSNVITVKVIQDINSSVPGHFNKLSGK